MGKIKRDGSEPEEAPEDLAQAWAAAGNFPKDRLGVLALAQALKRAATDFRIPMRAIVDECCSISAWCPTPYEIRSVAMGMRDAERNIRERS